MKKIDCPLCGSPSFVSVDNQFFCFSCGMGGDRISYLRAKNKISYKEAAKRLNVSLLPEETCRTNNEAIFNALTKASEFYFSNKSPSKTSFLKKRKISKETMEKFKLGYADGDKKLYHFLKKEGITDDVMEQAGLLCTDSETGEKFEKFWKRVMFPIRNEEGRTIGFGGRVLKDQKPKYLNSSESVIFDKSHNLYALDVAKETSKPFFLLAEGYVDVISLHQNGFSNAVASLGTAFTSGHAELLAKYSKPVYIVYDSDEAGQKATEKAISILLAEDIDVKVVSVAPYKDVDELLVAKGADFFQERINAALDGKRFLTKKKSTEEIVRMLLTEL